MSLSYLGEIGAHTALRETEQIINDKGYDAHLPCNPYTGRVSIIGALAMACGAKQKDVEVWSGELQFTPVPDHRYGLFMELVICLEAMIDDDLVIWSDNASADDCTAVIKRLYDKIESSVF